MRQRSGSTAEAAVDRIDRAILKALQAEGRLTNQALAERVHLSPSACLARVRRLEKEGVIAGYHARLRPERIGPSVRLFAEITLSSHDHAEAQRVERYFDALPEACEVVQVSGNYDYLVRLVVPSIDHWVAISDALTDGELAIAKVTTVVALKRIKPFTGIPL